MFLRRKSARPSACAAAEKEFLGRIAIHAKLKNSTVGRYRILFRELDAFAAKRTASASSGKQLDVPVLNKFRATWKGRKSPSPILKKLSERLRSFFKFALANGYIQQNPAAAIRNPKIRLNPTLPFSQEEMLRIFAAAGKKITDAKSPAKNKARRVRALIPLVALRRSSNLRAPARSVAKPDRLQNGKLFCTRRKREKARLLSAAGVRSRGA